MQRAIALVRIAQERVTGLTPSSNLVSATPVARSVGIAKFVAETGLKSACGGMKRCKCELMMHFPSL